MSLVALAVCGWAAALAAVVGAGFAVHALGRHWELVARAAHEVRGPLTAIGLGLELQARETGSGPAGQRGLRLELARAALALDDLTRRPDGRGPTRSAGPRLPRVERVDVGILVAECVESARARARAAGASLGLGRVQMRVTVWGDRVRLAQAVGNLIANAIEHGGGEVEVRLRVEPSDVRIEVCDGGPGLPAPVSELVRRCTRGRGRRGRGLAIASAIAERHRGRVAAAPAERGARIVLELPRAATPPGRSSVSDPR